MKRISCWICLVLVLTMVILPVSGTADSLSDEWTCVRVDHCIPGNDYVLILLKKSADSGSFTSDDILFLDQVKAEGSIIYAAVLGTGRSNCKAIAGGVFSNGVSSPRTAEVFGMSETGTDLTIIEEEAFAGTAFTHLFLNPGVEEIGSRAFAGCTSLSYVFIPASVTKIADNAFSGSSHVVICCEPDSEAYRYAVRKNMKYRIWQR